MTDIKNRQLEQIEYLLTQSTRGQHLLFENPVIAKILRTPTESLDFFTFDNMNRIQEILTQLIAQESVVEQQMFLKNLPPPDFELLLRTYFHIVENTILSTSDYQH